MIDNLNFGLHISYGHKERFFATIHHQPVDRPASWLGLPVPLLDIALANIRAFV